MAENCRMIPVAFRFIFGTRRQHTNEVVAPSLHLHHFKMAKGRKHGGRQHQMKKNVKKLSKGEKRHLKAYGEQHPADEE